MKLESRTNRQSFLSDSRKDSSSLYQDCLVNNCACIHCIICGDEGHNARRFLQKGTRD